MNDAAGVAQGVRREFETLYPQSRRSVSCAILTWSNARISRPSKDMARLAREENEALKARVAALEAAVAKGGSTGGASVGTPGANPASDAAPKSLCHSLFFETCAAISAAIAAPAPLEAAARFHSQDKALDEDNTMADRQSDQGGDTSRRAARGRPGRTSRWPRTRNHLWRRQAAAADLARLPLSCTSASYAGHFLTTIHDVEVDGVKHRVIPRDFQL